MNHWKIHATTRRKNRARNDILGLLGKSHSRKQTNKKTKPVSRRQFGIFAKSQSFKVTLLERDANVENDIDENEASQLNGSKNTPPKRSKRKKSRASAKHRMPQFDVVDLIDDNVPASDANEQRQQKTNNTKAAANNHRKTVPSQRTTHSLVEKNNNRNIQHHSNENDFFEFDDGNHLDFGRVTVDFTIGSVDATVTKINAIDYNHLSQAGSIDFIAGDNHIEANTYEPSADARSFRSDFIESSQESFYKSVSNDSNQSDWLLETPNFSCEQNADLTTTQTFKVDERIMTENSIETVLTSINDSINGNGLTGFVAPVPMNKQKHFSSSQTGQCYRGNTNQGRFRFEADTNHDMFSSQRSISKNALSSIESTSNKNPAFNNFNAPTQVKPFTLKMVLGRRSLGAKRSHERIFGNRTNQLGKTSNLMTHANRILQQKNNDANRPKTPVKSFVSPTFSYKNTFENPIWIL